MWVCVCVCVHIPSVPKIGSIFAQSPSCLGGSIVGEPVPGLMENSFLLHCLELYSANGEGKLLNTITVSSCTVSKSKAWASPA